MANYVKNRLTIQGKNAEKIMQSLVTVSPETNKFYFDFNKIVPMPDFIFKGNLGQKEKEEYGKNNWYDWSITNWGTKWNALDTEYERGANVVCFETAWSDIRKFICKLSQQYPTNTFMYDYAEERIGFYTGQATFQCGENINNIENEDYSKEAYELAFELWGQGFKEEYKFDKKLNTYVPIEE